MGQARARGPAPGSAPARAPRRPVHGRCTVGPTDAVGPRGRAPSTYVIGFVDEAAREHPGVDVRLAKPIGIDPLVAEIIEARVVEAMSSAPVVEGVAYDP